MRYMFFWVSLPAISCSFFLMSLAGAPKNALLLQCAALLIGGVSSVLSARQKRIPWSPKFNLTFLFVVMLLLWLPLWSSIQGPQRWLNIGGFQLYVASLLLPSFIYVGSQVMNAKSKGLPTVLIVLAAAALAMQPDASQTVAFGVAIATGVLVRESDRVYRTVVPMLLLIAMFVAWQQPDPLEAVVYVEGVIQLAMSNGWLTAVLVVFSAVLPVIALLRGASLRQDLGLLMIAIYYVVIMFFAYQQKTPMPWLGFGVGPVLGYFLMTYVIANKNVDGREE